MEIPTRIFETVAFETKQLLIGEHEFELKSITAEQTLALRQAVLWPDYPLSQSRVDDDGFGLHLGLFFKKELVCVASLFLQQGKLRLRKFACQTSLQNSGLGSTVLHEIIRMAKANPGIDTFWCDARQDALGFYQRFGLSQNSKLFYKHNVAYVKMEMTV
ncbi:GNAT family N-acetyltransferase [Alginatibacterium sediminis]|uniref:GNAT family N-acetyltransferase n=1 Tax=Alginatibacterium sediminis TaxID=2164068 RepID=A0A420E5W5_9ALTE|nr:GNAT family N-acetyltransferase [Alginatibacterium sediminis]RKF13239.1 GNAT family N-acetyltransferase [Alginatibacterium sediminis]